MNNYKKFVYEDLPSRGKIASDGEKASDCICGSRVYVFYLEDRKYSVQCETGGILTEFNEVSKDMAIKRWNKIRSDMKLLD